MNAIRRFHPALAWVVALNMLGFCNAFGQPNTISIYHALHAISIDKEDAEKRTIMGMTTALPFGAVGFLDNGCTAALIDRQHILAASHCFTFDYDGVDSTGRAYLQGEWQQNLVFFPNYHPSRSNPPRVRIDRVIVGSRVQGQSDSPADWGIAHLVSPVSGFPVLNITPKNRWQFPSFVRFAGYARDDKVYPRQSASFPEPSPGGYCANFKPNCWWIPAFVDPKCLAIEYDNGFVRLDNFSCLIQGGNSGSPVIWNIATAANPKWRITGVISGPRGFWSADRFQYAPRYATDVAISTFEKGTRQSQVFVTDLDSSKVVSRYRTDSELSSDFFYFRDLGKVVSPRAIAAVEIYNGKPLVIVAGSRGRLWVKYANHKGVWSAWNNLQISGISDIRDIALSTDANGVPQLYIITNNYKLYTGSANISANITWRSWKQIYVGAKVNRVSVVRHTSGQQQLFVITTAGVIRSVWQTSLVSWSNPIRFSAITMPHLIDVSAGKTSSGKVQVFTIDKNSNGWIRSIDGFVPQSNWTSWANWFVPLYAPNAATPPKLTGLVSITAGHWRESSIFQPVLFSIDNQGNIYQTSYEKGKWKPWRSFYN